jgi:hypothetical protein
MISRSLAREARLTDMMLSGGEITTFAALRGIDKAPVQHVSAAADEQELALWRRQMETGEEVMLGYDDALHLPEFPIGPTARGSDFATE